MSTDLPPLTTLDRAKAQCPGADDVTLATLISVCSRAVERYCRRQFWKAAYDELHHGTNTQYLFVDCPPVVSIQAVRTGPTPALYLQNNQQSIQSATVDVQSAGLTLTTINNATPTTTTLTWADYPTMGQLATAVNAYGHGWVATLSDRFTSWASSDFHAELGSFSARNQSVGLNVYFNFLSGFRHNPETGEIYYPGGYYPGYLNVRVQYTGGYADIPDDLQHAVCELVQLAYAGRNANPLMQSESLDRYSYSKVAENSLTQLSWIAKQTLNSYKLPHVPRWSR